MIFTDWINWILGRFPDEPQVRCATPEENVQVVAERERTLTLFLGEVGDIDHVIHSPVGLALQTQLNRFLAESSDRVLELIVNPKQNAADLQRLRVEIAVARELRDLFSTEKIQEANDVLSQERHRVAGTRERLEEVIASHPVMGKDVVDVAS